MIPKEKLSHGLYKIHWEDGGTSLAAIGTDECGDNWLACTNWLGFGMLKDYSITKFELIAKASKEKMVTIGTYRFAVILAMLMGAIMGHAVGSAG